MGSDLRARPKWVSINTGWSLSQNSGSLALPDTTFLRVTWDLPDGHILLEKVFQLFIKRATSGSLVE